MAEPTNNQPAHAFNAASIGDDTHPALLHQWSGDIWLHDGSLNTAVTPADANSYGYAASKIKATSHSTGYANSTANVVNRTRPNGTTGLSSSLTVEVTNMDSSPSTTPVRTQAHLVQRKGHPRASPTRSEAASGPTREWHDRHQPLQQQLFDVYQCPHRVYRVPRPRQQQLWAPRPHHAVKVENLSAKGIAKLNIVLAALPRLLKPRPTPIIICPGHDLQKRDNGHVTTAANTAQTTGSHGLPRQPPTRQTTLPSTLQHGPPPPYQPPTASGHALQPLVHGHHRHISLNPPQPQSKVFSDGTTDSNGTTEYNNFGHANFLPS